MPQLAAYHRPSTLEATLAMLREPGRIALAGGTTIRHEAGGDPVELVDLQALGLDSVSGDLGRWSLGAMVHLDQLAELPDLPELVRWAARAELPSTLRTVATVGGTVAAADPDSVLVAALLVCDATVGFADGTMRPLADLLESGVPGSGLRPTDLIVAVDVDGDGEGDGRCAHFVTGRTPADTPIVAALGRVAADGSLRLALTGVADRPVLVDAGSVDALDPPGDFRGSTGYRRHLATVLSARVRGELA